MRQTVTSIAGNVRIDLGDRSYDIDIGSGLLEGLADHEALPPGTAALIVTNQTVQPLYGPALTAALKPRYPVVYAVVLPDGEEHKNWQTLNLIFDALLQHGCDRKTVLFALGGGVVGDMTGFAAASYMRGVPFVQVPTTLLAQVDSSVGGKTAINHPLGKNMIGAFYQPLLVVCDLATLDTLPARELSAGLAEVVKYGAIADAGFFAWLEDNAEALMARNPDALAHAIATSCRHKAGIVARDETEQGERMLLNFGHTFGHAIETGQGYGGLLHGEAIAVGMVLAARLSADRGRAPWSDTARLAALLERFDLPVALPAGLSGEMLLGHMKLDKKAVSGRIRLILWAGLGQAEVVPDVPESEILPVLEA